MQKTNYNIAVSKNEALLILDLAKEYKFDIFEEETPTDIFYLQIDINCKDVLIFANACLDVDYSEEYNMQTLINQIKYGQYTPGDLYKATTINTNTKLSFIVLENNTNTIKIIMADYEELAEIIKMDLEENNNFKNLNDRIVDLEKNDIVLIDKTHNLILINIKKVN